MKEEIKERLEKIEEGIVPEGYKKTKVGIIPEDWEVKKLSDINKINTGLTPLRSKPQYFGGNTHWVKTGDLNNSYITDTEENVTELALKETSLKYVKKNSILIAMYGGFNQIGRTGLMKIDGTTNQAISSLYIDEIEYNSEYTLHWLSFYRGYWKGLASSSRKDPNITKKDVEDFPIPKPIYAEQKKIATILSTWDKAIENIEKLIKEKEVQKKGLMQELLTGETRLPGFNGKWEEVKLGEISKIQTGKLDANAMVEDGKYKFFTCAKEAYNIDKYAYDTEALLVSGNGANVGYIHYYKGKFNAYQRTYILDGFRENILFVKYLLDLELERRIFKEKRSGNTPYITMSTLTDMILSLPPLPEQKAIAEILSTADKEIELLNKLLEKKKEEKKGLMQLLLTGIVRV